MIPICFAFGYTPAEYRRLTVAEVDACERYLKRLQKET